MNYQSGVAGLFESLSIVFIITISRLFLTAVSPLIERGAQFTWIGVLLAGCYTLVAVYILLYVFSRVKGDIYTVSRQLIGNAGAWLISIYYFTIFWFNGILLLRQYAENTLTTALPNAKFEILIAFYMIFTAHLCFLSLGGIARATGLFLWYIVALFLLICILLLPYYNMYQLTPWQGHGIKASLLFSLEATSPNIGVMALFVLAPSFQNLRTIKSAAIYGLSISVSLKSLHSIVYLMVFGMSVASEKVLPFFEMARLVYFNQYFQHIEALLILAWVVCGLLSIAASMFVAMYILAQLLNLPALRPFMPLFILLSGSLALLFDSFDQVLAAEALFLKASFIGLFIIPLILFAVTLLKLRNKPCVNG